MRFLVAGSGTHEEELRAAGARARARLDHGTFLGWIGDDVLHSLYRIADLMRGALALRAVRARRARGDGLAAARASSPTPAGCGRSCRTRSASACASTAATPESPRRRWSSAMLTDDELRERLVAEACEHVLQLRLGRRRPADGRRLRGRHRRGRHGRRLIRRRSAPAQPLRALAHPQHARRHAARRPRSSGTSFVTTAPVPTIALSPDGDAAQEAARRSRSTRCCRRARRACRSPGRGSAARPRRRRGRSRSASRGRRGCTRAPIETCWKAEIVHSWPEHGLGADAHLALVGADLACRGRSTTSGRDARRRRGRSRTSRPGRRSRRRRCAGARASAASATPSAASSRRYLRVRHAVRAREAQERERPAVQRRGLAADLGRRGGEGLRAGLHPRDGRSVSRRAARRRTPGAPPGRAAAARGRSRRRRARASASRRIATRLAAGSSVKPVGGSCRPGRPVTGWRPKSASPATSTRSRGAPERHVAGAVARRLQDREAADLVALDAAAGRPGARDPPTSAAGRG